ncbi:MAG TPA: aspartate aminotransferase family protein, partial [Caldimonas sp.]
AGLMISVTAERVVRLLPALIMTAEEAGQVVALLCPLIRDFLSSTPA